MGFGKWIAGALGWAMFGPIGGILGYYFASRVEKLAEATVVYGEDQTWNQGQRPMRPQGPQRPPRRQGNGET